ncbi:hypothetical protein KAJ02_13270, partial [Candidatus Bipolaricaulota bacterium]|nr:hypothetical protein [Candidatus Bipolaricaulota bacterium]
MTKGGPPDIRLRLRAIEMTRFVMALALGLLLPAAGQADLYVKKAAHSASYVEGVVVGTRQGDTTEMWIGDGKIASHEGNKTILLDLEKDWFCIVNHHDKSFVETSLPLDVSKVLAEDLRSSYKNKHTSGKVEKEDRRREMASRECREYTVSYWDISDG